MTEIHVEPKKQTTPVWIWILVAFAVLGVIAYFLIRDKKGDEANTAKKPGRISYTVSPQSPHRDFMLAGV